MSAPLTASSNTTVRLEGQPVPFAQFIRYAWHDAGCGKFEGSYFAEANHCTCGLTDLFGGEPCPCRACSHRRGAAT